MGDLCAADILALHSVGTVTTAPAKEAVIEHRSGQVEWSGALAGAGDLGPPGVGATRSDGNVETAASAQSR
jgi:hypothetical protein